MPKTSKTLAEIDQPSIETQENLLSEIDEIANQLGRAASGSFDFAVQTESNDPTVQKLTARVNFLLDTLRRTIDPAENKNHIAAEPAQALQKTDTQLHSLVQSAYEAIVLANSEGKINFWNRGAQLVFGYTEAEILGQPLTVLMPERYQEAHQKGLARLQETGQPRLIGQTVEVHGLRKDGSEFPLEISLTTWQTAEDTFYGGIIRDITKRKQLERQTQEALARRGRQIHLSTQIAHDIALSSELENLYPRIVTSITKEFGYYHAQLLRYDPSTQELVLAAGYGDVGARMLAENRRISAGIGLIGLAAASGTSILRSDISADPDWLPHPLLPHTKGELTVPIKSGGADVEVQVNALETFIKHGFDGFSVATVELEPIIPVVKKAMDAGLHVVMSDDLDRCRQTAQVYQVEYDMGYTLGLQAGQWAKEHIPPGECLKLGLLTYSRFVPQMREREEAIITGIKEIFGDNVEVVDSETANDSTTGLAAAEKWLRVYPDLKMIVGFNDATALGAYQAVIAAGKDDPDTFFVGGIDAVSEALRAIKAGGAYQATVDVHSKELGALTVRTLVTAIAGQPYKRVNPVRCDPVNRSNVDQFLNVDNEANLITEDTPEEDDLTGLDLSHIRIGYSVQSLTNPYFIEVIEGAQAEADRLGITLIVNDPKRVLGVLDVQSDIPGALNVEDQLTLEGVCAQLAAAIEGNRLLQETKTAEIELENRLRELNALQRLMTREGWQAFQSAQQKMAPGYLFDQTNIHPMTTGDLWAFTAAEKQANKSKIDDGKLRDENLVEDSQKHTQTVNKPMVVRGEVIGALGVQTQPDQPLSLEDQRFLEAVADQVAEALERARLLEQTQKRAVDLEAVAQVSAVTSTTLETQKLLQTAVDLTKSNFGLYHAHIYLLDETEQNLTLAVGAGEVGRQMVAQGWQIVVNHESSLVAQVAQTRRGVIVNDVRANPHFLPNPLLPETRSEMAIPMIAGDRLLGVLDVQADEVNRFKEEDVQAQTVLATQVAVALRNANLYQQTQTALAETESLYNAGRRLNEANNLQEIVSAVVEGLSLPIINRAVLVMFERDLVGNIDSMTVAANWHSGRGASPLEVGARYPQAMLSGAGILRASEPLFFDDILQDDRIDPATLAVLQPSNIRAMAVLPLAVGLRQLGSLLLEADEPHKFTDYEIRLYRSIMGQAAVAIENQRLLNETRSALAEVEATQRRYTVQAWETYRTKSKLLSHEQVREGVTPLGKKLLPEINKTMAQKRPPAADGKPPQVIDSGQKSVDGGQVLVPLTVRGETIGVLGLQETDEAREWSAEEFALIEAIAEQLAQAAENIRLIDETQQRAARERKVNEVGEKIRAAQSLEEALQIAIREVGVNLQAPETSVKLEVK